MESPLDILVVDDNPIDLVLFSRALRKTHFNCRLQTLTSGQQAIDYLSANGEYNDRSKFPWPDLIVLDLKMPGVNGFDFLAWRKASTLFSSVPVFILSGSDDPNDVKRIYELGGNKHLVKPLDPDQWDGVIQEIWDSRPQDTAFLRANGTRSRP